MSSLTIHSIDPELNTRLGSAARSQGKSKNQLIKEILAHAVGLPVERLYKDDYGEFCGLWSAEECAEFESSQAGNQKIDPEDWSQVK